MTEHISHKGMVVAMSLKPANLAQPCNSNRPDLMELASEIRTNIQVREPAGVKRCNQGATAEGAIGYVDDPTWIDSDSEHNFLTGTRFPQSLTGCGVWEAFAGNSLVGDVRIVTESLTVVED